MTTEIIKQEIKPVKPTFFVKHVSKQWVLDDVQKETGLLKTVVYTLFGFTIFRYQIVNWKLK